MSRLICVLLGIIALVSEVSAQAVWTGLGDSETTTAANWSGGVLPATDGSQDLTFPATTAGAVSTFNYVALTGTLNAKGLVFSASDQGYEFYFNGDPGTGSVTVGADGINGSAGNTVIFNLYDGTSPSTPRLILSASQVWNNPAFLEVVGTIGETGGSRSITQNGGTVLLSGTNTFSGGYTVANAGSLALQGASPVGTGPLTLGQSATLYNYYGTLTLANPLVISGSEVSLSFGSQTLFTGPTSLGTSDTTVHLEGNATAGAVFQGEVSGPAASAASNSLTFTADGTVGSVVLQGPLSNLSTLTVDGSAQVVLDPSGAVAPSTALPTGSLSATHGGYLGLADAYATSGPASPASILPLITDKPGFNGTLGFDSVLNGPSNTFTGAFNLSGFTNDGFTGIGSSSTAVLDSGFIYTPPANAYLFGGGGGRLVVQSNLGEIAAQGGHTALVVNSPSLEPLTLVLQGANTFQGPVTVSNSFLILDSAGALSSQVLNGGITLGSGAYLGATPQWKDSTDTAQFTALVGALGSVDSSAIIGLDSSQPATQSRTISNVRMDFSQLAGTPFFGTTTQNLTVDQTNTLLGPGSGVLSLTGVQGGNLIITAGLLAANNVNSLVVGYPGALGEVTLGGNNTYAGGTLFQAGDLFVATNSALGTGTLTTTGTAYSFGSAATLGNAPTISNPIFLGNTIYLYGETSGITLAGPISGAGSLDISDTVVLSGNNSFTGGVVVDYDANLTAASDTALGTGPVQLVEGATLAFTSAHPIINDLSDASYGDPTTTAISLGSGTALTLHESSAATFSGQISGAGSLLKTGTGLLTLSGANSYTAGTTIAEGGIIVAGSSALGTGPMSVASGAILGTAPGITVSVPVTTADGAVIADQGTFLGSSFTISNGTQLAPGSADPGSPVGTLTFGSAGSPSPLTLGQGGSYAFNLMTASGAAGTDYTTVVVNGTVTLASTPAHPFTISITSFDPSTQTAGLADFSHGQAYSWTLLSATSLSGSFDPTAFAISTVSFQNDLGGRQFSVSEGGNALLLNFSPVPEPSTYALMGAGLCAIALTWYRVRQREQASRYCQAASLAGVIQRVRD